MSPDAPASRPRPAERPDAVEWSGWGLLAIVTAAVVALAVLRPTDPAGMLTEIRLAAGFDRYQAAMADGDRIHSTVVAELRQVDPADLEQRRSLYGLLARAAERYRVAREESEGFFEDQRAQARLARTYLLWARELHRDGTGAWYERNDAETLRRAREIVDRGLALPDIPGDQRVDLEELGTRIDRALTPWPIL